MMPGCRSNVVFIRPGRFYSFLAVDGGFDTAQIESVIFRRGDYPGHRPPVADPVGLAYGGHIDFRCRIEVEEPAPYAGVYLVVAFAVGVHPALDASLDVGGGHEHYPAFALEVVVDVDEVVEDVVV